MTTAPQVGDDRRGWYFSDLRLPTFGFRLGTVRKVEEMEGKERGKEREKK